MRTLRTLSLIVFCVVALLPESAPAFDGCKVDVSVIVYDQSAGEARETCESVANNDCDSRCEDVCGGSTAGGSWDGCDEFTIYQGEAFRYEHSCYCGGPLPI